DRVVSGIVLEDGSLVLKLYYDADEEDEQEEPEEDTWTVTFLPGNRGDLEGETVFRDIEDGADWDDIIDVPDVDPDRNYRFDGWSERFPDTIEKDWVFVAQYERISNNDDDDDEPREEPEIEVEEETPEAPPVITPPVVTPPVETPVGPPETVEVPVETPAAAPTLPKTGSVGAGEMAGIGALLMAIGVLLKKKKGF
ncbi:MAG: LPXTG cell wall anchor domain-containing protein, partial [Gudongella sp.]|nr:LPXTG cell wall anchor domain-containing protein [Gudongella sp.]